jgi:hypothetical protein
VVLKTFFWKKVPGRIEELKPTVFLTYSSFKPLALTYVDAGRRTCEIRLCRACPQGQNLQARLCWAASLVMSGRRRRSWPPMPLILAASCSEGEVAAAGCFRGWRGRSKHPLSRTWSALKRMMTLSSVFSQLTPSVPS